MEITITLSKEDQLLQAEILKVLLKGEEKETQPTPKPTEQPTPKPYPMAGKEEKEETPLDTSSISDKSDKSDKTPKATEQPTPETYAEEPAETPSDAPEAPTEPSAQPASEKPSEEPSAPSSAVSMEDLRKSVNAISRTKGLNWLYSWLGDLGVKSIAEIPAERLEEANTKLQNYK